MGKYIAHINETTGAEQTVKEHNENTAELCHLSTQVFLNAPNLVEHLEQLNHGKELTTQELLNFYRNDIASLERIVISNPYLYAIRVYSSQKQIDEMFNAYARGEPKDELPTGIDPLTLNAVRKLFKEPGVQHTAETVAQALTISRTTARRYLEY